MEDYLVATNGGTPTKGLDSAAKGLWLEQLGDNPNHRRAERETRRTERAYLIQGPFPPAHILALPHHGLSLLVGPARAVGHLW